MRSRTHTRKSKLKRKTRRSRKWGQKGGGDLPNTSFCKKEDGTVELNPRAYSKMGKIFSPAYELFASGDKPFSVENLELFTRFKQSDLKWFKFVAFDHKGIRHLYVLNGDKKGNKHPLCYIYGVLENSPMEEYADLRAAIAAVEAKKGDESIDENSEIIVTLNNELYKAFGCMRVYSAGSGTILPDNTLCINTKSGHFRPKMPDIDDVRSLFEEKTGMETSLRPAHEISELRAFTASRGVDYDSADYSGMCIPSP